MKTIKYLYTLLAVMLLTVLPATAQNTNEDKNKAIIETNDGSKVLNTDDIQVIRFDGGKVTVEHSEGETTFDRTLRSLSFQRPNPGTLRLTATTSIGTKGSGNRAQAIDDAGYLKATWAEGDQVYVYADNDPDNASPIGTLYPKSTDWGNSTATLTGNINADGLSNGQTLYFSTKPRPYDFSSQDGTVGSLFYCTAEGTLNIVGGNATISDLDFERTFAVVKFTLMDKGNGDAAINAKSLVVNANGNTYTVTTLAQGCYNFMFYNCSSLNSVTCLATNIPTDNYTYSWLNGVPLSGTFNKAASMTSWDTGFDGIPSGWMVINEGVLPGQFTVNTSGGKVSFSMGNLQAANIKAYSTSGWKWTFAGHQYDYVGDAVANTAVNGNGTISTGGTIDLFGWSTSATYYGIHNSKDGSTYSGDFVDWGGNAISNGGNTADLWRTLSNDEWGYLFNTRTTTSGVRYAKARVNGVAGVILLPDDWSTSYYKLSNANTADAAFISNIITLYDWVNSLESRGAVFLPAAGYREGTSVQNVNAGGGYWSSDYSSSDGAYCVSFYSDAVNSEYNSSRFYGGLVRLVKFRSRPLCKQ